MSSLPSSVRERPVSTSTEYTTASEVVERATPAKGEAFTLQWAKKSVNAPAPSTISMIATERPASTEMKLARNMTAPMTSEESSVCMACASCRSKYMNWQESSAL